MSVALGRVVHATPGRVRVRVAKPHRTPETFARIEGLLRGVAGVQSVEVTRSTGSVLVRYDPGVLDARTLLQLGGEHGLSSGEFDGAAPAVRSKGWRSQVNLPKVARSVALLGAGLLGGMVAPGLGISRAAGSLSAAAALVLLRRRASRARARGGWPARGS